MATQPMARVLVADDDAPTRAVLARVLERAGHEVVLAPDGHTAWATLREEPIDVLVTDVVMPGLDGLRLLKRSMAFDPDVPVVVTSGQQDVDTALGALRAGAYDYLAKPVDPERLVAVVGHLAERHGLALRARASADDDALGFHGLVGRSPAMRRLFQLIRRVARYPTPVLVLGESGTGKELVARAVHDASPRAERPYVAFNGAGVAESLFESTLFGHIKGAFTGGTLFMDEIGEMALANQAKLLRVLETREVRPVGSPHTRLVEVRIVSATNADLRGGIAQGRFREDLFYRLRGVVLEVPPLRARGGDVRLLAEHFLRRTQADYATTARAFDPEVLQLFEAYPWPGNVRELRLAVASAAMLTDGDWVGVEALPPELRRWEGSPIPREPTHVPAPGRIVRPTMAATDAGPLALREVERANVQRVIRLAEGNRSRAAKLLGVSRHALYRLLDKHALRDAS